MRTYNLPPRYRLAELPTPLQEAPRLRDALGGLKRCPRILIKRDDLTGLATGGNKARKFEFTIAQALADGVTALVTTGSLQSNHARTAAAAARLVGMRACLVLTTSEPNTPPAGNHLLDLMLGADIRLVQPGPDPVGDNPYELECLAQVLKELTDRGEKPLHVTLGASDSVGTGGYTLAAMELEEQLRARDIRAGRVYVAAGSRGTQAGLILGAKMANAPWQVHGIAISPGDPQKTERAVGFTNECAERFESDVRVTADDFLTHQEFWGEGYAIPTAAGKEAIRIAARTEALVLDPVYTGKAMGAMISHIRAGLVPPDETIVFMHTGGTASVFAQIDQLDLTS
jgi:1-aminocyclopropane-1-carboxylate deaminase/D-cysteine desulfhydrase-like pyridoxal-dependent ACC family enzyme